MEQKPLVIIYEIKDENVWLGWGLEREKVRCNLPLGIGGGLEGIKDFCKGRTVEEAVHESVISLFNDENGIMADIKIPRNYPYEFYLSGSDVPVYRGHLREVS